MVDLNILITAVGILGSIAKYAHDLYTNGSKKDDWIAHILLVVGIGGLVLISLRILAFALF